MKDMPRLQYVLRGIESDEAKPSTPQAAPPSHACTTYEDVLCATDLGHLSRVLLWLYALRRDNYLLADRLRSYSAFELRRRFSR